MGAKVQTVVLLPAEERPMKSHKSVMCHNSGHGVYRGMGYGVVCGWHLCVDFVTVLSTEGESFELLYGLQPQVQLPCNS